ncbi:MAG: PTS sugar transporter subunit IIA [Calditrichaeota bacterium]|nr:MAG: PTS sugar transporter subunit IIA [Calditrichota bacterium]
MKLDELLSPEVITFHLHHSEKFAVIEELLDLLVQTGKVRDRATALQDLIEREKYLSTGFENGLAVPHAKTRAVDEMVMSFALSREGIDFDSLDGKPTHFIFLLLSPQDVSGPHIQLLALIARNFQKKEIVDKVYGVQTPEELLSLFHDFK